MPISRIRPLLISTSTPTSLFLAPPLRPFFLHTALVPKCPSRPFRPPFRPIIATPAASQTQPTLSSEPPSPDEQTLVIVESPAKAATIQKILPASQYAVHSCVGHVRDIPSSAKRIPARYKHLPWARLGVDTTSDFRPIYVLIERKQSIIRQLKAHLTRAHRLVLATDDDREGEAIAWHLLEVLNPKIPVLRAVFHEITPDAIHAAFHQFRTLDMARVDAQETRRVLDRLAGYTMSPLLWKKVARGLSAGRVQSVAMSVIVNRERKRLQFRSASYAGCAATFVTSAPQFESFSATLSAVDNARLVRGSDFDDNTGKLRTDIEPSSVRVFDQDSMAGLSDAVRTVRSARVISVDCRRTTRHPPPPLITSTLQQECGNRLGMGAGKTMQVAQKLYETGVISYMRTDNPVLSKEAVTACRISIVDLYGDSCLWHGDGPPRGKAKPNAQAAHEAIRPTGSRFPRPEELTKLSEEEISVYSIIFRRTLASQMSSATLEQTTVKLRVDVDDENGSVAEFKATGSVLVEPGFLSVYKEDTAGDSSTFLPRMAEGDVLTAENVQVLSHVTKPPARFNDASLVKVLEERGVGRPSTYAGIIEKLITRGYIYRGRSLPAEKKIPPKALVPSLTAFAVNNFLSQHFPSFVDAQFTAKMEEALDEIASGSANRVNYLREYYCGEEGLAESVARKELDIDAAMFKQVTVPGMDDKGDTKVLVSWYGPYVEQDGTIVASLPKTTLADDLLGDRLEQVLQLAKDPVIGTDPASGLAVLLKTSRFGPYVQLGYDKDAGEEDKPKRCGLFPGMDVGEVTVEVALKLLSLPRVLGVDDRSGEEVRAALGPYGPYVVRGNTYVSLQKEREQVLEIELQEATEMLDSADERKQKRLEKQLEREKGKAELSPTKTKKASTKAPAKASSKKKSVKKKSSKNGEPSTSRRTSAASSAKSSSRNATKARLTRTSSKTKAKTKTQAKATAS